MTDPGVYDDAADLIETHGWTQFMLGDEKVGFCLIGAIRQALHNRYHDDLNLGDAIDDAVEHSDRRLNAPARTPADPLCMSNSAWWNDQEGRTRFEVVDHLRHLAKTIRNTKDPE